MNDCEHLSGWPLSDISQTYPIMTKGAPEMKIHSFLPPIFQLIQGRRTLTVCSLPSQCRLQNL